MIPLLCASLHAGTACGARVSMPADDVADAGASSCNISASAPRRLMLADSSRVIIDPTSVALSGQRLLILASAANVFAPGPLGPDTASVPSIGLLREVDGRLSLVPTPLEGTGVHEVQAIADGGGGWHVIFATGTRGTSWSPVVYDSATIWYGRFDGVQWREVTSVALVRHASLLPRSASGLVLGPDGVAFAFPYDNASATGRNPMGSQGIVLMRQQGGAWVQDTLPIWDVPQSVQLLSRPGGSFMVVYSASYFSDRRPRGPALFTATFRGRWGEPLMATDPSPAYTGEVIKAWGESAGNIMSWRVRIREQDRDSIAWGISRDSSLEPRSVVSRIVAQGRPAVLTTSSGRTLWFVREHESTEALAVFASQQEAVERVSVINVPLLNFVTHAAELPDGRVLVLTGGRDTISGADPPYASYLTEIAVRCPAAPDSRE